MPYAQEPADWRKERAISDLEMADHIRKSAARYAHETQCDYGERWARALELHTRDELLAKGYEEPTVQPGRDPAKLKAMPSKKPWDVEHPEFAAWLNEGVEGGPDVGA